MSDGDRIAAHLRTIRASWPDMLPTGPHSSLGELITPTPEPPTPVPIGVLSLRRELCEALASWVRLVVEDALDVNGGTMVVHLDRKDAESLAGWLLTWADWLGTHAARTVALDELGDFARRCDAVVSHRHVRRFRVGPCIEHGVTDKGERVPCTGTLVAVLSSDDDLLPSVLRCDLDPAHAYAAGEWRRLGERIHPVAIPVIIGAWSFSPSPTPPTSTASPPAPSAGGWPRSAS